jgi:predicted chitinase
MGNGDEKVVNHQKFIGRGALQLTGKNNIKLVFRFYW